MSDKRYISTGFTIIDLVMVLSVIALLLAMALPVLGRLRSTSGVEVSLDNLVYLGVAHALYAADWDGRQFTTSRDDFGMFGNSLEDYIASQGVYFLPLGWSQGSLWIFTMSSCPSCFEPIVFQGPGMGFDSFRIYNFDTGFHEYVNGRTYDPIFFAPKDKPVYDTVQECLSVPGQFVAYPASCNPTWASYCLSPAGLFDPRVFSDDGEGKFFNEPWEMPSGYRVPSFGQVKYPDLKTQMIEYNWLQNPSGPCNPAFGSPQVVGAGRRCEPYYFNHSFMSKPATLFYDGSVRLTSVVEMMSADRRHQRQAGYGLWSRDTPFGDDGYYISDGYDFAETSFHLFTIDGVRGRDTTGRE